MRRADVKPEVAQLRIHRLFLPSGSQLTQCFAVMTCVAVEARSTQCSHYVHTLSPRAVAARGLRVVSVLGLSTRQETAAVRQREANGRRDAEYSATQRVLGLKVQVRCTD
jgi:hypothetical protein